MIDYEVYYLSRNILCIHLITQSINRQSINLDDCYFVSLAVIANASRDYVTGIFLIFCQNRAKIITN